MSKKMGPMVFGQRHELIFLGRDIGEQRNYSEPVAREIDKEVNRIVTAAHEQAREILTKYAALHEAIAQRLIEVETMDAEEFESFFANIPDIPPSKLPVNEENASAATETPRNGGASVSSSDRPASSPNPRPAPA
jgi:seryl-tRNA synthetase